MEVKFLKKYVIDFAKDEMRNCTNKRKAEIQVILKKYESGLITSLEAVKSICDTYYERILQVVRTAMENIRLQPFYSEYKDTLKKYMGY